MPTSKWPSEQLLGSGGGGGGTGTPGSGRGEERNRKGQVDMQREVQDCQHVQSDHSPQIVKGASFRPRTKSSTERTQRHPAPYMSLHYSRSTKSEEGGSKSWHTRTGAASSSTTGSRSQIAPQGFPLLLVPLAVAFVQSLFRLLLPRQRKADLSLAQEPPSCCKR